MTPTDALQAWLALEHEAVWLYPVLGARFDDLVERATTSFEAHRDTRDAVLARLRALDAEPVSAQLSYDMGALTTAAEARAAARTLEAGITAACLTLTGATEDDARAYAIRNLTKAALAEMTWGAPPRAFPGLP
ncbi:MAG: hypothetical protein JWR55_878 [Aeromicrobium sp.]|jgi:hypothetical protein|nr:hypothetical protein [Aeromicrobium sp.]